MLEKNVRRLVTALLCVGLLCALVLCGIRVGMESENDRVLFIMSEEGATQIRDLPASVRVFDGESRQLDGVWLLVEDLVQYSYEPDPEVDTLLADQAPGTGTGVPCVRCFYLNETWAARYNYLGYPGAEELENIFYRAITDRNIRVVWMEPFTDAQTGEAVTDGAVYAALLQSLSARLARQGLTLGTSFSVFPAYSPAAVLLVLTGIATAAACVLLLMRAFGLGARWALGLLLAGCVGCVGLYLLRAGLAVSAFALAASVAFPCLAIQLAAERLAAARNAALGRELAALAGNFALCFLIALAGGLFVGALQSSTAYLLAIENFRGVKLSQAVPVLFAVYVVLRRLCPIREILRGKKYIVVLAALALLVGLALFLLRTGDGFLSVSGLEQRFRNWLERAFLVRPRTKEFLVAWPCFGLAFGLCARGARRFCWPFAVLMAPGFASVVNTFCHSRAPIWLSAVRSLLGALIGLAFALVLAAIFHRIRPAKWSD